MGIITQGIRKFDKIVFNGKMITFYNKKLRYQKKAYQLSSENYFPPHSKANKSIKMGPYGDLLAVGGDLSTERIIHAFKCGVYPMFFADQPLLWWTSEIRCVIFLDRIHIGKHVKRLINQNRLLLSVDQAFEEVVENCANSRKEFTWLTPERISSFKRMFAEGYCHSVEVWEDGQLAGGLFWTAIGSYVYVESSFTFVKHASKYGACALAVRMSEENLKIMDCGIWPTDHLRNRLGAEIIDRNTFLDILNKTVNEPDAIQNYQDLFKNWDFKQAIKSTQERMDHSEKNFEGVL